MTEYVTYESKNAKPIERWLAYAVLPNGQHWLVRCCGETEEIALTKCRTLYEAEKAKSKKVFSDDKVKTLKQHHLAGKVWMINKTTNHKIRIDASEVSNYEWAGYIKGGPRS